MTSSFEPKTTYHTRQEAYRENVAKFFQLEDHYIRLTAILNRGDTTCSMLMYFVTKFAGNKVYATNIGFFCPKDAYCDALRSHQKRFYNFESRAGCGDLWYNGIRNPRVMADPKQGSISLSLPRLVALQWAIQHGFDTLFLSQYKEISTSYQIHTQAKKKKYTEAHKKKKKNLRCEIETKVIHEREEREEQEKLEKLEKQKKVNRIRVEVDVDFESEMGMELENEMMIERTDRDESHRRKPQNPSFTLVTSSSPIKRKNTNIKKQQTRRSRRQTRLSREERRKVTGLIKATKLKRQKLARMNRLRSKKRENPTKCKPSAAIERGSDEPLILNF